MSVNWQYLNTPGNLNSELTDEPLTRVVRVLQKAGFCIYPSDEEAENIAFMIPFAVEKEFPQNFHSNN
ncbi:MAG: hypothetical protein PHY28_00605 [Dehalococcoidales bacterium]|nr:hypothetical protein [Dehalococcoidales bacterium]